MDRPGLSASQLENSLRKSQRMAESATNSNSTRASESMAQTQRLLKVLQSHPIARPDSHLPYPHLTSSSHFASTLAGRTSPPPSSRDGYDVLGDFRKELERVRREVSSMAHTEKVMEQRNRERMEQLAASSVAPSIARDVARSRDDAGLMRSTSQAPSQSLLSSINTLLSSPKLNRELAAAKRDSYAKTAPTSNSNNLASSFGLAPSSSQIHTPFASTPSFSPHASINGSAPSSNDPHMQSLYAKGNVLLTSQSSALDQSHAKLQSILSSLHHWKNVQAAKLSQTVSEVEAKQAQQIKNLIESFELERNRIEERARIATDEAKRAHARSVENHVEDLHHAVERELQRGGGMLGAGFEIHHPELSFSSSMRRSPSRSPTRNGRSSRVAELERSSRILSSGADSMRMDHLSSSSNTHHHYAEDDEEDEKESQRAIARRKKLYYASAVNGAASLNGSASVSSLGQSLNSTSLKEGGRKSVNALLYSSDDEETDAASIQKKELLAQARFIQTSRLKDTGRSAFASSANLSSSFSSSSRSAPHSSPVHSRDPRNELLVNEGISGRSRGRGKAVTKSAQAKAERARADARVLLESSSSEEDENPEDRKQRQLHQLTQSEKEERRRKLGVSFGPDASRSPSPSPSPSPSRKRRSEKEEAAAVFAETSSDEETERTRPLGGVHTNSVTSGTQASHIPPATSGRIHASPQKSARQRSTGSSASVSSTVNQSSLKEMSQQLQKKVATLNQQSANVKVSSSYADLADD